MRISVPRAHASNWKNKRPAFGLGAALNTVLGLVASGVPFRRINDIDRLAFLLATDDEVAAPWVMMARHAERNLLEGVSVAD